MRGYDTPAPQGTWTGRLDHLAWGLSSNLLCYFTNEATGFKHRLSVFNRQDYAPYDGGPSFNNEELDGRYEITTAASRTGQPKFIAARQLSDNVTAAAISASVERGKGDRPDDNRNHKPRR